MLLRRYKDGKNEQRSLTKEEMKNADFVTHDKSYDKEFSAELMESTGELQENVNQMAEEQSQQAQESQENKSKKK